MLTWDPLAPQGGTRLVYNINNGAGFASMEEWQEFQNQKYVKDPSSQNSGWVVKPVAN